MIAALRPRLGFEGATGGRQRPSGPRFTRCFLRTTPLTSQVKLLPRRLQQLLALYLLAALKDYTTELPQQTANVCVVPDT